MCLNVTPLVAAGTEQTRYVERIVEHADYDTNSQENDITLLKLSTPLQVDGLTVSPVCLPPPMTDFTGGCHTTTCWCHANTCRCHASTGRCHRSHESPSRGIPIM